MKHLGAVVFAAVCFVCLCGFTVDFGTRQAEVDDTVLQGGWFNYDAKAAVTGGKSLQQRAENIKTARQFEMAFPDVVNYLERFIAGVEVKPNDGRVVFHPHEERRFTVMGQSNGRRVDRDKLYGDILAHLKGTPDKVVVEFLPVAHMPANEIVKKITKRAEFSTHFEDNPPREHNIALAVKCFDGLVVEPGQEISFNKIVGRRSEARGYQEAKIIIDGEYVEGVGGGVCQVSTTVFNAAVRAGLHITESHNHSLRSSYVPLGHDAMVSSAVDLRFANTTGATVYFETAVRNNRVFVTVYGRDKGDGIHYALSTLVTKKYPPAEKQDTAFAIGDAVLADFALHPEYYNKIITHDGEDGYATTTYIETYKGERLLSKKVLRRSTYRAQPIKYRIVKKSVPSLPTQPTDLDT